MLGIFNDCMHGNNLMKKGYGETDLSELQLIYFATHSVKDKLGGLTGDDYVYTDTDINYLMRGGNYEMAVNTLSDWLSAAREESAPYETAAGCTGYRTFG